MKTFVSYLLVLLLFVCAGSELHAQKMTVILLRHAEKDISAEADKNDPVLTAEGMRRAEKLLEMVRKYKPNAIYSTNFKRTRSTVTPLAENLDSRYRYQIQIYDHKKYEEFTDQLLKSNARTAVIVGHNASIPAIANLLIKQDKYKTISESEYGNLWIIEINKSKIKEQLIQY